MASAPPAPALPPPNFMRGVPGFFPAAFAAASVQPANASLATAATDASATAAVPPPAALNTTTAPPTPLPVASGHVANTVAAAGSALTLAPPPTTDASVAPAANSFVAAAAAPPPPAPAPIPASASTSADNSMIMQQLQQFQQQQAMMLASSSSVAAAAGLTPEIESSLVAAVSSVRLIRRVYRAVLRPQLRDLKVCAAELREDFVARANEVFRSMRLCSVEARQLGELAALDARRNARVAQDSRTEQTGRTRELEAEVAKLRGENAELRRELATARSDAEADVARIKRTYQEKLMTVMAQARRQQLLPGGEDDRGAVAAASTRPAATAAASAAMLNYSSPVPASRRRTNSNASPSPRSPQQQQQQQQSFHMLSMSDYQPPSVFRSNAFLDEIDELLKRSSEGAPPPQAAAVPPPALPRYANPHNGLDTPASSGSDGFPHEHTLSSTVKPSAGIALGARSDAGDLDRISSTAVASRLLSVLQAETGDHPDALLYASSPQPTGFATQQQQQQHLRHGALRERSGSVATAATTTTTVTNTASRQQNMSEWARAMLRDRRERSRHRSNHYATDFQQHAAAVAKSVTPAREAATAKQAQPQQQQQQQQQHLSQRQLDELNHSLASHQQQQPQDRQRRSQSTISASGSAMLPM